jgi:hypothetical protein
MTMIMMESIQCEWHDEKNLHELFDKDRIFHHELF